MDSISGDSAVRVTCPVADRLTINVKSCQPQIVLGSSRAARPGVKGSSVVGRVSVKQMSRLINAR